MTAVYQPLISSLAAERASERFYGHLAVRTEDPQALAFFLGLIEQRKMNVVDLEKLNNRVKAGRKVDIEVDLPDWEFPKNMSVKQGVGIALEFEERMASYYDGMASLTQGEISEMFGRLAMTARQHKREVKKKFAWVIDTKPPWSSAVVEP
jgi:rubrerythrin